MDLTETTVETDQSFDSDLSDDEYADCQIKARKPQDHKDVHGRRCGVVAIELPPTTDSQSL